MVKCDLCKREIGRKRFGWVLVFYNLKNIHVCEECDMSINEQIVDNLDYFWNNEEKENVT
jgi:hypothetical protein